MNRLDAAWILGGAGLGALYLAVQWVTWLSPFPPGLLFDGYIPPPPYRWVHPPYAFLQHNQPPQSAVGLIALTPAGSAPGFVQTEDTQIGAIFPGGAFAPEAGERAVEVRITPLDPARIAPAPSGLRYDTNAYRIDAAYAGSHRPAALQARVSVVLRYATGATVLLYLSRSAWVALSTAQPVVLSSQIYGSTQMLGVFAAAAPREPGPPLSTWIYRGLAAALGSLAAVMLAWRLRGRLRLRRRQGGTP